MTILKTNDCTKTINLKNSNGTERVPTPNVEETQALVQHLLNAYRPIFKDSEYAPSTQGLFGIMMARFFEWKFYPIMEASIEALEDANYGAEAFKVRGIMESEENQLDER